MENFVFCNPTKIYFGRGQEKKVGEIAAKYASRVLLVYGRESIHKSGLYNQIIESLKTAGIHIEELAGVVGNPKLNLVYEGIRICKEKDIELLLAVGGGSVLDTAKAISVGAKYDGDVWDFYIKKAVPQAALPVGTILTVAGAGSEMSNSNVITKEDEHLKRSFDNDLIYPAFSILNPELTYTVSAYQTGCGVFDTFSHLLERYFTKVKHTDVTDRMLEGLMKTVIFYGPLAQKEPYNYDYRAELMWASTWAQNGSLSTGRIGDWGCHAIEHELSGEYDIAHGEGLAMITSSWMRYVCHEDMERFVQFAHRVFGVDYAEEETKAIVEAGICGVEIFAKKLGLDTNTKKLAMTEKEIQKMSVRAVLHSPVRGRFLRMKAEDIECILKLSAGIKI